MVWNHIVIVCELFMADGTLLILFDNLAIQQFPHFGRGPEFPISPRMMWVPQCVESQAAICVHRAFVPGRSRKSICELGSIHCDEVSLHYLRCVRGSHQTVHGRRNRGRRNLAATGLLA